jgi:DNA-binding transcriptional regulator YiaG
MNALATYLRDSGTTQDAFAKRGNWRQATVSDWVTGRKTPSIHNAAVIERLTAGAVPLASWVSSSEAAA